MAKNLDPKCKQCRRIGEKLFLKGERCETQKCGIVKKNYAPGIHGPKARRAKPTAYGIQLTEKQKAKKQYNILEKQFRLTFEKARRRTGDAGDNLIKALEMRFDNIVYRAGIAKSRPQARTGVSHYHFIVNGKKVNIPSCSLKKGDIIEVSAKHKKSKLYKDLAGNLKKATAPGWLNVDAGKLSAKVLHEPTEEDIQNIKINPQMIVEFYSR